MMMLRTNMSISFIHKLCSRFTLPFPGCGVRPLSSRSTSRIPAMNKTDRILYLVMFGNLNHLYQKYHALFLEVIVIVCCAFVFRPSSFSSSSCSRLGESNKLHWSLSFPLHFKIIISSFCIPLVLWQRNLCGGINFLLIRSADPMITLAFSPAQTYQEPGMLKVFCPPAA